MSASGATMLLVGIDFGTTFSGASWLLCKDGSPPGQPEVVSLWKTSVDNRRGNSDRQKVPSKIYFDENGEVFWGFRVPAGVHVIEWFKLLLLNTEDLQNHLQISSHLHDAKQALSNLDKTAVQLVSEYLKALWNQVLEQICNAKGQNIVDGVPIHLVLSVPAIWTDCARNRMREAAGLAGVFEHREAGNTTLSFISEPEAAAIATMPELEDRGDLQVGDSLVVIDAGGGTVDIISYKINSLEPLSVSECVEGDGALCGGTFLDKEFEALLKHSVGLASWNKMYGSDIRKMMNNEWEHGIKESFDGQPDYYTIELPSRAQSAPLEFSTDELKPIFDKIMSQIHGLVEKQISAVKRKTSKLPKLAILVGGFGKSPYVLKYLKDSLNGRTSVLQSRGDKPWTAICRGAVLSGAAMLDSTSLQKQPPVQSRISRMNYGWLCDPEFVVGIHDPRDREFDHVDKRWKAINQIEWFVKRGDDVSLKEPKTHNYHRIWEIGCKGRQYLTDEVYTCNDLVPPSRLEDHVRSVAEFSFWTPEPVEEYERVREGRHSFRNWSYGLKVCVSGASLDISVIADGEETQMSKVVVQVD